MRKRSLDKRKRIAYYPGTPKQELGMARKALIHFHGADDRFCGSTQQCRQFSLDPNDVTCPACQDKDTLTLSTEGAAFLASLSGEG
jgi:hypothetical protein